MPEPSLRYEIVSIHGEMRNSRTEYILGRNSRSESRDCRGYCDGDPNRPGAVRRYKYGPLRAYIQNRICIMPFNWISKLPSIPRRV